VDARAGGVLHLGGVVRLDRGRFEGKATEAAVHKAMASMAAGPAGAPGSLVVHREGSLPRSEREVLEAILSGLAAAGHLAREASVGFVELGLDHPFRLFQEGLRGPATCRAGSWALLDENTALVATAGYPSKTRGTPDVLMVGTRSQMDVRDAVRDVQLLGALDWGGREVRWPATVWGPRAEMGVERARPWG
jgi:hypothetical protein